MTKHHFSLRRASLVASLVGLVFSGPFLHSQDILFQETFEAIAVGALPGATGQPGEWQVVDPGRSAIPAETEPGAIHIVPDDDNAFGAGPDNQILRFDNAQDFEIGTSLPSTPDVITLSFDFIGRDKGQDARWINIRFRGGWDPSAWAHIFSLQTRQADRDIRLEGTNAPYGDNGVPLRFDVIYNAGWDPITYDAPGGGTVTLGSGLASVWIDGVQVIEEYNFAGVGYDAGPVSYISLYGDSRAVVSADFDNLMVLEGAHVLADFSGPNANTLVQDDFEQPDENGLPRGFGDGGIWSDVNTGLRLLPVPPTAQVVLDADNRFGYGAANKILRLTHAQNFNFGGWLAEGEEVVTFSYDVFLGSLAENSGRWANFELLGGDGVQFSNDQRAHITGKQAVMSSGEPVWRFRSSLTEFGPESTLYRVDTILNNSQTETLTYTGPGGSSHTLAPGMASTWVDGVQVEESWNPNRHSTNGNYGFVRGFQIQGDSQADITLDLDNITIFRGAHVMAQIGPDVDPGTEGYTAWQQQYFPGETDPAIVGPAADASGDGVQNLIKYALGLDPTEASREGLPVMGLTEFTVEGAEALYLTLAFTAPDDVSDVGYSVGVSSDLAGWLAGAAILEETIANGDGTTTYLYRDSQPLNSAARRFMQLEVSIQE